MCYDVSTKVVMEFDYNGLERVQKSHPRATGSILRFQRAKRISWLKIEIWVFSDAGVDKSHDKIAGYTT